MSIDTPPLHKRITRPLRIKPARREEEVFTYQHFIDSTRKKIMMCLGLTMKTLLIVLIVSASLVAIVVSGPIHASCKSTW